MVDISSYANESVLRPFNLINFTLSSSPYVTQFVDVSKYSYFTVFAKANNLLTITINHSVDASGLGSQQILEPLTPIVVFGAMTDLGVHTVKSRFIRLALNGTPQTGIDIQLVFHEDPLGLSNLTNVGSGTQLFVAPGSLKTLTSTDASVTITSTATTVNLAVAAGTSPYQQTADDITPVSLSVNSQTSGDNTNQFGTATNCQISSSSFCDHGLGNNFCTIDSSETCVISGANALNCAIMASITSEINGTGVGSGDQNVIIASVNCDHGVSGGNVAGNRNSIMSSTNSSIIDLATNNSNIISCDGCDISTGADYSGILSSQSCTILGAGTFDNHITGSNTCNITSGPDFCSIDSSVNSNITGANTLNNNITGSNTCNITTGADFCTIDSSENSTIIGDAGNTLNNNITSSSLCTMNTGCDFCTIDSSTSCTLGGARALNCSIISSNNCDITSGGADLGDRCTIIASEGCNITPNGSNMAIMACLNTDLGYVSTGTLSAACAFSNLPHPGGGANCVNTFIAGGNNGATTSSFTNSAILGSNWSVGHTGLFMFTDNGGGTTHSSNAANSFSVRCVGGARFLSNAANTTGVRLAAGASAWAAVSDRNKKENIVEIDCDDILERVKKLPIYKYNFKGNAKEIECIGPMAQDWHEIVTPLQKIEGYKGSRDAKDKLSIEDMDMIGVCLAAIKALTKEVEELKALIKAI